MKDTYTYDDVIDLYSTEKAFCDIDVGFEQFIKEYFIQTYDINMNFIGYERR